MNKITSLLTAILMIGFCFINSQGLAQCANLTPYQPGGWDNKIVVSTTTGNNTSATSFNDNQTLYIDWAILNGGTCNITATFTPKLYVDGVEKYYFTVNGLNSNTYTWAADVVIGPLTPGSHTIQIVSDANGNVSESIESDNSYTRTINVSACANLTPYQPGGWDNKIVLSTVTGTTTSSSSFISNQNIYIDWAAVNNGTCNISKNFTTRLFIDGSLHTTYNTPDLASNTYTSIIDGNIGMLSAGPHTIQIVVDVNGDVGETNEADNSYSRSITVSAPPCANLTPFQPAGWDDKIVLTASSGTNTSTPQLWDNQTIYVDWAAINNGSCNITQTFYTKLYVDGVLHSSYNTTSLQSTYYAFKTDIAIGPLSAGTHTIQITTDGDANINETNELDNSYSRTVTINNSNCANLTPYQHTGWDNIIVLSTTTGTNTSASTFTSAQTIYMDWGVINNGSCSITQTFNTKVYIDGVLKNTYNTNGLQSGYFTSVSDINLGTLAAGSHTIQITTDGGANVNESNELDNSYSRIINVISGSCPTASVNTAFNGTRTINTELFQTNNYRLNDNCHTASTRVRDWNSTTTTSNPLEITSSSNTWSTQNQRFGGSVLWAAKQSYNYFLNNHARASYDNLNGDIDGYINAVFTGGQTDNASMSFTGGLMKVGLGASGTLANSWCTIDLIGHEYTHAVTGASANLQYLNEPGALNESFSDIFGESIENNTFGTNDWLIASERTSGAIRSMSNPNAFSDPDTYQGTNWKTGSGDFGGVHSNSGVQNFWYYLLVQGGIGTNDKGYTYNVPAIGIVKARAIAYRNLTVYLTSTSDYAAARSGSIQAAEDLYGINSAEANAVKEAWCAVGVGTCAPSCVAPGAVTVSGGGTTCGVLILTATGGNGGTIYFQGTTSNGQSTANPATGWGVNASGTYYFRAMNSCGIWGPEGSATVIRNTPPNTWTGAVSTAWENAANWSCGSVPDASSEVVINSGTVIVNANTTCRSLTVAPGAVFRVKAGVSFKVLN